MQYRVPDLLSIPALFILTFVVGLSLGVTDDFFVSKASDAVPSYTVALRAQGIQSPRVLGVQNVALPPADSLIKGSGPTIYYYASDGFRHLFPSDKIFYSWFSDYDEVVTVSDVTLSTIPLKGAVTYRPGVRLIKTPSSARVYSIDRGGVLRWIQAETTAATLYGEDWNKKIDDVPELFLASYDEGEAIADPTTFEPAKVWEAAPTINHELGIEISERAPQATTQFEWFGFLRSEGGSFRPFTFLEPPRGIPPFTVPRESRATSTPGRTSGLAHRPTSTPSGTIPAIPATPATPSSGGGGATPATPATPAVPGNTTTSTTPVAPSNLVALTSALNTIDLTWNDNSTNDTGFKIERASSSVGIFMQIGLAAPSTTDPLRGSFRDVGLAEGTTHFYRVRAYNSAGDSAYSNIASATTSSSATVPTTPTNLTATPFSTSMIDLLWNDNSTNETGFLVERATSSSGLFTQIALSVTPSSTNALQASYRDTGLTEGVLYYYRVRAYNGSGYSSYSNTASARTIDVTPPIISSVQSSGITASSALITWTTNELADSLVDYGTTTAYGSATSSPDLVTQHSFQLTGLQSGTLYHFRVVSKDASARSAASSDTTFSTLSSPPPTPAIQFVLSWGTQGSGVGQFTFPYDVEVDSSGNVYVADGTRIKKFDSNANFVMQFGSSGSGNGQFKDQTRLALDSAGNIYVADQTNHRVEKFDANGNYLMQFGSFGSGNGQFYYTYDVALDSQGNIYVTDASNNRVQKFAANGQFLLAFGSYGTGNGQFYRPGGLAIDRNDNVYVPDYNGRVQKFDSSGRYLSDIGGPGTNDGQFQHPEDIAFDSSGNLYVVESRGIAQKFDASGTYLTKFGSWGSAQGQFLQPNGIAIDSNNNIYVADTSNYRIQKFH